MTRLDEVSKAIGALQSSAESTTRAVEAMGKQMAEGFDRVASSVGRVKADLEHQISQQGEALGKQHEKITEIEKKQAYWAGGIAGLTSILVVAGKALFDRWIHGP